MRTIIPKLPLSKARIRNLVILLVLVVWASCARMQLRQGWNDQLGPVMPHDTFPADCSLCHIGGDWQTLREDFFFDHEKETGVALTGAHHTAQCLLCHNDRGPVQQFAARGCAGCHVDVHMGRLGPSCDSCHHESNWRPSDQIAMHNRTRFPLVGAHAAIECFECHKGAESGVFLQLDVSCVSCHRDDFLSAQDPNHVVAGFSTQCQECHVPVVWQGAGSFAHPANFPLVGGHAGLNCSQCHVGNNFSGISTACVSCHLDDFQATNEPNHVASGFSTDCRSCHNINDWNDADFNHNFFPITSGPHAGFDCNDCHINAGNPSTFSCINCHEHNRRDMEDEHDDVGGFVYSSPACLNCHPDGHE